MIINTAGDYTLRYTATDECGNSSSVDRSLTVASPRTVLYTDGTFIINEAPADRAANEAMHGGSTNEYIPFNPNGSTNSEKYIFSSGGALWRSQIGSITSVEIGSPISPTSTAYWFQDLTVCESFDLSNLDTSLVTNMNSMFNKCKALEALDLSMFDTGSLSTMSSIFNGCESLLSLDLSGFNTNNVSNIRAAFTYCKSLKTLNLSGFNSSGSSDMTSLFAHCHALETLDISSFDTGSATKMPFMFEECYALKTLDVSNFDTRNVTEMSGMFSDCDQLETIYASASFVTSQVTSSTNMFNYCTSLVGGAGTVYSTSFKDKTRARIDNPPDAPGYFTLKTT